MNIPKQAIQAAAEGVLEAAFGQELPEAPIDLARAALEAALPHIEAALRTQIATDIRADITGKADHDHGLDDAARIAEEGTTK